MRTLGILVAGAFAIATTVPVREKFYSVKLRLKDDRLHDRAYVGSEITGETEIFTRVAQVPLGCDGRQPESTSIKGVGGLIALRG